MLNPETIYQSDHNSTKLADHFEHSSAQVRDDSLKSITTAIANPLLQHHVSHWLVRNMIFADDNDIVGAAMISFYHQLFNNTACHKHKTMGSTNEKEG